ncbi:MULTISPECIES: Fe-S cluster assembly sulfur transfer protein SufU [Brevibacterium]|uniref:SUF system NifU family Fe-S cluster assembly protein n=1 Tax=Brevibacterium pityocampae TaxID=506594 RepID=A0ABP8JDR4_9MICO|nr:MULTISPECIES: SUF system NifU family Fe-S cluster assembly protein [Actinomycetes]MCK1802474.1 SUF system NifU family Fe-S cluster assembly protein [Brevibacterium sp. R8603A2]MCX0277599.1 SUF system NifU family Fe-S cluster assembly protein [Nocardia zapadnayensis]QCP05817.1 SUF system NifU family Fe-S cluster assembly protein [Brevibacterium sp. CS2]
MSDLQQLYQQVILDHAKQRYGNRPLLGGTGIDRSPQFGSSHQVNPTCGDEITVEAEIDPGTGALTVRWDGQGCSISMASASVLTEIAEDTGPEGFAAAEAAFHTLMHSRGQGEADEDVLGDAAAFQGVSKFPARIKCALLSWMALKDALAQAHAAGGDHA